MTAETDQEGPSYRALLRYPGFGALTSASAFSRLGEFSTQTALLLFVLTRFPSPALAAAVMVCRLVPGLLLSPLAGALLDRMRPSRLIGVDLATAGAVLVAIAGLDMGGLLTPGLLLAATTVGSCTSPLSVAGTRSLVAKVVPRTLWSRANAVDSGTYVVATMVGPAGAGVLVSATDGRTTLAVIAAMYLTGAAAASRVPAPPVTPDVRPLLQDIKAGVIYLARHRTLRNLAVIASLFNVANGLYELAVPITILDRYDDNAVWVGLFLAVMGIGGVLAGLVVGRWDHSGKESAKITASVAATAVGLALFALDSGPLMAAAGMLIVGAAGGAFDVVFLSLRQRVTDTANLGRVIALSTAANMAGAPVGTVLAPPLLAVEHFGAGTIALLAAAGGALLVAALVPILLSTPAKS
ncbi:MFS transporter [Amycolatopsis japonica]